MRRLADIQLRTQFPADLNAPYPTVVALPQVKYSREVAIAILADYASSAQHESSDLHQEKVLLRTPDP